MTVTLAQLRERVRQRADIQNQTKRYPDTELTQLINDSYKELYGTLVRNLLIRPEATQTITTDGSASYALNSDHFATLGVFFDVNGDWYSLLARHSVKDRPFGITSTITGEATSYRIAEISGVKRIEFFPVPSGRDYYITYVPFPDNLTADTDTVAVWLAWPEYVVLDASIKALRKENTDTRALEVDRERLLQRITDECAMTEMTESLKVTDTRRNQVSDPADYRWYRPSDYLG